MDLGKSELEFHGNIYNHVINQVVNNLQHGLKIIFHSDQHEKFSMNKWELVDGNLVS
jgi:hypothetical protein